MVPPSVHPEIFTKTDDDDDQLFNCRNNNQLLPIGDRIGGGQTANREQFPWHTAIYYKKVDNFIYHCGGTLVTRRAILTAAHCVTEDGSKLNEQDFLIYMGLFSLKREIGGEQIRKVSKIMVHPEYDRAGLYSDIAVVKFLDPIEKNSYVLPICLWEETDDGVMHFSNMKGVVAGWGLNENGQINENLTFLNLPIVSRAKCIEKDRTFYTPLLNGRTYCAGDGNGKSVCNGDSGGGMVLYDKKSQVFRLRGVVSASIRKQNTLMCDLNFYAIFTDVTKFRSWLINTIYQ